MESNVPDEVKDICEAQLFQQFCKYQEPTSYSDLLLTMMRAIRSRWNATTRNINNHNSSTMNDGYSHLLTGTVNALQSGGSDHEYSTANTSVPRPINIQFRRLVFVLFLFLNLYRYVR